MSKPISFGFGKPKAASSSTTSSSKTSISLPQKSSQKHGLKPAPALRGEDEDDRDDEEPKHEALTGFGSSGAILSAPVEEKKPLVIENAGNSDWARQARQRNGLPVEVRAAREGRDVVMVEKDEVSTASGLQMARPTAEATIVEEQESSVSNGLAEREPRTADEEALQALLDGDESRPRGNAVITAGEDDRFGALNDRDNFQAFVESHPDSSTLEEYAAMPVEEFGLAMLRGMGKKRRANGEVINLDMSEKKEEKRVKRQEFLGIGAKAAPSMDGVELGAWGKADMRKNNKGAGFFTPLMVRDAKTGETITEDELERRKKEGKLESKDKEDWRDRRDRNLERHGRNGDSEYRDAMNDFSSRERDEDSGHDSSRSRKDKDRDSTRERDRDRDSDHDSSRSKSRRHRSRSRSKERRHRDDEARHESRRDRERERDRNHDRDKYRDKHKDRERDYERDARRHRDRVRDRR